ncbi:Shprh [Symbiodinium necroappetens]|uniref:Shprh protein n=1 Tax=Symbiodinium necroappetens TaxID=1628268 RepID=A0A813ALA0_9DINO|nr:Shprh [Symbiodinium necroappetens]
MEAITGPGPGKAISASSQAGSDLNTSAGGTSRQSANVERRIAWLEEDVAVLHRRVKAECSDLGGGVAGDSGLRALVARLDGELAQERRMQELLEARMVTVEESLQAERKDREASINTLASELDKTMKGCERPDWLGTELSSACSDTKLLILLAKVCPNVEERIAVLAALFLQDSPLVLQLSRSTFAADEPGAFCASLSGADTVFCISRLNAGCMYLWFEVPGSGLGAGYSQVQGGPGMTLGGYPRAQVQTLPAGARSPQQVMRVLRN